MRSLKLNYSAFTWLRLFILSLLVLGLFFRFVNLDRKTFWIDEVHSLVRAIGYTKKEFVEQLAARQWVGIEDLQRYQQLTPERDFSDTMRALAGNSEHSPLYYLSARLWMQLFGSSVTVVRSLSALFSLLVFPAIYWLCRELFPQPQVAWLAVGLMAVSPFHVLYAQEARQYSLWTAAVLFSSAAVLQALRLKSRWSWVIYATTVALGFYSHLLFAIVLLTHGLYLAILQRGRWHRTLTHYLLAAVAGLLTFAPWLLVFVNDSDGIGGWVARKIPLLTLFSRWAMNLSSLFLDIQVAYHQPLFDIETGLDPVQLTVQNLFSYAVLLILLLVGYAIYYLVRQTEQPVWLFISLLIAIPALVMLLPDLISGGQRSSIGRYLIPCYLGVQLAVAYLLATGMTQGHFKQQRFWQCVTAVLVSVGVFSCAVSFNAETWWNKYSGYYNPQVAQVINQTPRPLVISGAEKASRLTSLSYLLDKETQFLLWGASGVPTIPEGFSDLFFFRPTDEQRQVLEQTQNYRIEPVYAPGQLWRIKQSGSR